MTTEAFQQLPELLKAKEARDVLRINDAATWAKVVAANPDLAWKIPGMSRPKYRKRVVARLAGFDTAPCQGGGHPVDSAREFAHGLAAPGGRR